MIGLQGISSIGWCRSHLKIGLLVLISICTFLIVFIQSGEIEKAIPYLLIDVAIVVHLKWNRGKPRYHVH